MHSNRVPPRPSSPTIARSLGLLAALGVAATTTSAFAQAASADTTPAALERLLQSAHDNNADLASARAALAQARSQVDEARARLLPSFTATGTYTRNEIQVQVALSETRVATITPYDQLDARFAVTVPIVDASSWASFLSAEAAADASEGQADGAQDDVDVAVTQLYYQLVAGRAMAESARRSLTTAEQSLAYVTARHEAGVAPTAELARAQAEVFRGQQSVQEADLAVTLAERNLNYVAGVNLHGVALEPLAPAGEVHTEPLETYLDAVTDVPSVRNARLTALAAERAVHGAWLAFVPSVSATAAERVTNAAGFGAANSWSIAVQASWSLDFLRPAQIGTRDAALAAARARLERTEQQARYQLEDAWTRAHALEARARAAEAALAATQRAADDTRARYETGVASQLELVQADRDLFAAEVVRIQALADLEVALQTLAIRSHLANAR